MKLRIALFCLVFQNAFCQKAELDSINRQIASFCNYQEKETEKPIHLDWVQTDTDNINILNKLYNHCNTLEDIEKVLPNFTNDEEEHFTSKTYDCGYNLKSTHHQYSGGYGSIVVSLLYFENKVLKIRLIIAVEREIAYDYLLSKIKFPLQCLNNKLVYEKINSENLNDYRKKYGNLFIEFKDENPKRQEVLNYFSDALSGSTFEQPYYLLYGLSSPTLDYIRYLIVAKDFKGLKQLLYSPSPTSRLLAANTLVYLKENNSIEDNKRINEIIKKGQKIKGGVISCLINKFDYDYYDINKDFEKYLLTE
jgi:hypothetical protein